MPWSVRGVGADLDAGSTSGPWTTELLNLCNSDGLADALSRLPDLSEALHQAPPALKRQVFEAFCPEVRYDKLERRIEISATVSEAVAQAFENAKDLPQEVSRVTLRDIAGAPIRPSERRSDRREHAARRVRGAVQMLGRADIFVP